MITRIVKFIVKGEFRNEFTEFMKDFLQEVKNFKNNQHIDYFEDKDTPNSYHIYTIWSTTGALNKFRNSDLNKDFKSKILEWGEKRYSAWTVENIF